MTFNEPMLTPNVAMRKERGQRAGAAQDKRMEWFREARFGLFIHWGLYAIPAGIWKNEELVGEEDEGIGEWIMFHRQIPAAEYEQLAGQFNPVEFDADAWVSLAKAAGQKYITITAKHHEGFCMFKSAHTTYNIVDGTPFGRDVCKELAEACARHDIKLCFYYSQTQDWHHPGGYGNHWDFTFDEERFADYLENYVKPQVTELLTNYGPIGLIWFDTPYGISEAQSESLLELVHALQPDCLVSGRVGNAMGDYASAGDNRIPEAAIEGDFETPATINDTWGYKSFDHNWKSVETLIRQMVDIVSKNGNYLLNVGPDARGNIPQPSADRLEAMGAWLKVNGESIYACGAGPVQQAAGLRSTQKGNTVYLHVFDLPEDGIIKLAFAPKVREAALLMNNTAVGFKQRCGRLTLQLPEGGLDPIDTVVRLTLA
ncbi:MAG: alpha-L-fucosidase [Anaerolineaceae bacterium]|nr:alpha-L-fucosidase [Anaerolineaceae bacterium]